MRKDIYGDKISYVTDEISTVPTNESNLNEDNRIKFVTDLAAVSRGLSGSKNPPVRYKALLKEASPTNKELNINEFTTELYTCPNCKADCKPYPTRATGIITNCVECGLVLNVSDNEEDSTSQYKLSEWDYKLKGSPSRPLEFLPIVMDLLVSELSLWDTKYSDDKDPIFVFDNFVDLSNGLLQHSYLEKIEGESNLFRVYTNMRAVINAGIPYSNIPYNTQDELKHFRALKANIPMFVWGQVPNTHCALSKEAQSDRVTENTNYWLPNGFRDTVFNFVNKLKHDLDMELYQGQDKLLAISSLNEYSMLLQPSSRDGIVHLLLDRWSQTTVQSMFKELGYHQEIYSRAVYYFKYKEVVFTGWNNNPKVWEHLFVERNAKPETWKNWTQNETKQFVNTIKEII